MAIPLFHIFTFLSLSSYGLHHLISSTRSFLKPSSPYTARPSHPLSSPHSSLRHLPLSLLLLSLLISAVHHALLLSLPSLQTALSLLFFILIALSLFLPPSLSLPPDLIFLLTSLAFSLLSFVPSSFHPSDLQYKCDAISSLISASSAAFSLALAVSPRLFLAEFALAASVSLRGVWSLQTVLLICVEGFVPEGCHRLLEVRDGSIRCELEESRARAAGILDLAFLMHVMFVSVVAVAVYAVFSWGGLGGGGGRRYNGGSYEALPTANVTELDHVQMKAMAKNSMQA